MRPKLLRTALVSLAALASLALPCAAHGSAYRLPGTTAPLTPGGSPAATAPPAAPSTGATSPLSDPLSWSWWWEFNKEPYLALRRGRGSGDSERSTSHLPPTASQIHERILPSLMDALDGERSNDVVSACLVALARIGDDVDADSRASIAEVIQPYLTDSNQEIEETAALSLGILGAENSAFLLADLLFDRAPGRKAVGSTEVSLRTRAFAAYALGLLGNQSDREDVRRFVVHTLAAALDEDESATPDVGVACVLALGRVPLSWAGESPDEGDDVPASASREAQIVDLARRLDDKGLDRTVRSHLPTSLAHLLTDDGEPISGPLANRVGERLLDTFHGRGETVETRLSCVIAFGLLGDSDEDAVDRAYREALRGIDGNTNLRRLAILSLARIGTRPGLGPKSSDSNMMRDLLRSLGRSRNDRARWTALGLALLDRDSDAPSSDVRRAVREELGRARTPTDIGAFAIAAGLLRDADAEKTLLEKLNKGDDAARGYAAVALGLIGAHGAADELRSVVEESTYRARLLSDAAIALGLLGDGMVLQLLAEKMTQTSSQAALAGLAQALGRVGESSSVEPMISLLEDERLSARGRAFAAVALGLMADRDDLPWTTVYSLDTNYTSLSETLYDANGQGLLNIL